MNEDIVKISSYSKIPKINIYPKETSNNISIEKDLSKYFSEAAESVYSHVSGKDDAHSRQD